MEVLHEMVDLASKLMFSRKRCSWKPIQTGLLLSTHSIIGLYTDLVGSSLYRTLLPSRLTEDPLENFFSQVQSTGDSHPSPAHFRQRLKLISVSQFMQMPRHSSYATDDCTYIVNFLRKDVGGTVAADQLDEDQFVRFIDVDESELSLSMTEGNALIYVAGWIVFKLRQQPSGCSICVSAIIGEISHQVDNPYAQLNMIKTYGGLIVPSSALFQLISWSFSLVILILFWWHQICQHVNGLVIRHWGSFTIFVQPSGQNI